MADSTRTEVLRILIRAENLASKQLAAVGAEAELAGARVSRMATGLKMGAGAIGLVAAGALAYSAKAAVDFQAMTQKVANNTTMTTRDLAMMRQTILQMSAASGAPLDQLAQGFMHITNVGYTAAEAVTILQKAMESAVSTGSDTGDVANTLAVQMHDFGMAASQAGRAMDVLHLSAAMGNVTLEDFVNATSKAVGTAANLGLSFTETDAALSALSRHMNISQASTMLAGMLQKITGPSVSAQKELAALSKASGIDLVGDFSAAGLKARGLTGVLTDLSLATHNNYTEIQRLIPATRGGMAAFVLNGTAASDYQKILAGLNDTWAGKTNPTAQAYAAYLATAAGTQGRLTAGIHVMAIEIGTVLLPILTRFLDLLLPIVQGMTTWIGKHPQITAAILGTVAALGLLTGGMALLDMVLGPVAAAIGALALPLAAVAAAGFGLYQAWEHDWGGIREVVDSFVGWLQATVVPAIETAVGAVQHWWHDNAAQIRATLTILGTDVALFVGFVTTQLKSSFTIWGGIVQATWGVIQIIFATAMAVITGNWSTFQANFSKGLNSILAGLVNVSAGILSSIATLAVDIDAYGGQLFIPLVNGLITAGNSIGHELNSIFTGAIKPFIVAVAGIAAVAFTPLIDAARFAFNSIIQMVQTLFTALPDNILAALHVPGAAQLSALDKRVQAIKLQPYVGFGQSASDAQGTVNAWLSAHPLGLQPNQQLIAGRTVAQAQAALAASSKALLAPVLGGIEEQRKTALAQWGLSETPGKGPSYQKSGADVLKTLMKRLGTSPAPATPQLPAQAPDATSSPSSPSSGVPASLPAATTNSIAATATRAITGATNSALAGIGAAVHAAASRIGSAAGTALGKSIIAGVTAAQARAIEAVTMGIATVGNAHTLTAAAAAAQKRAQAEFAMAQHDQARAAIDHGQRSRNDLKRMGTALAKAHQEVILAGVLAGYAARADVQAGLSTADAAKIAAWSQRVGGSLSTADARRLAMNLHNKAMGIVTDASISMGPSGTPGATPLSVASASAGGGVGGALGGGAGLGTGGDVYTITVNVQPGAVRVEGADQGGLGQEIGEAVAASIRAITESQRRSVIGARQTTPGVR